MTIKHDISILKKKDRDLLECFAKVVNQLNMPVQQSTIQHLGKQGSQNFNILNPESDSSICKLIDIDSFLISNITISFTMEHTTITFNRPINRQNPISDIINIQTEADSSIFFNIVAAIYNEFHIYDIERSSYNFLNEDVKNYYDAREASLSKFEEITKKFQDFLVNQTKEMKDSETAFRHELTQEFLKKDESKNKEYEIKQNKLEEEYKNRQLLLDKKIGEVEQKKKEIDDRDCRHVRREISDRTKNTLKEKSVSFGLTKGTNNKRQVVTIFILVILIISFSSLLLSFFDIYKNINTYKSTPNSLYSTLFSSNDAIKDTMKAEMIGLYFNIIHLIISAIAFLGATIFFIRWNASWFKRHADEEFRLQKLDIDLDRASWVVEMGLEWQRETNTPVPEKLIERLTTNLFTENEQLQQVLHPADELASKLLGASANVKLKTPAGELEFDRKSFKELDKAKNE